jgi:uncharacterized protein involved in exopolysaccharide biosynthesis
MKIQTSGRFILYSLFNRKLLIAVVGTSIFGTVAVGTLVWPRSYEASSSVIVLGRNYQNPIFSEPRRSGEATLFIKPQEEINTEIAIIGSRPVLERVVQALQPHKRTDAMGSGLAGALIRQLKGIQAGGGSDFEVAVARLGEELKIEPGVESQIVKIIYRDSDPSMASQVVNRVAEEYLQEHLKIHLHKGESDFYAEQIKSVEEELSSLRDRIAVMKSREGIISVSEQTAAMIKKLLDFEMAQATIQKEIISKRSKVERIRQLMKARPDLLIPLPEIAKSSIVEQLDNTLANFRLQHESLLQRYTPESRQVETSNEQISRIEGQIRRQVSLFLEREVVELKKLEAENQALGGTVKQIKNQLKKLPAITLALAALEKAYEDKQSAMTGLRQRFQDALVAQATDFRLQNAKIVSLASIPLRPVVPNIPLNLALGLVLALVFSLSAAFVAQYWDDSLEVPEDVEHHLGITVFASVPEL